MLANHDTCALAVDFTNEDYAEWDFRILSGPEDTADAGRTATHLVELGWFERGPLRLAIMPAGGDLETLAEGPPIGLQHRDSSSAARPAAAPAAVRRSTRQRLANDDGPGDGKWLTGDDDSDGDNDVQMAGDVLDVSDTDTDSDDADIDFQAVAKQMKAAANKAAKKATKKANAGGASSGKRKGKRGRVSEFPLPGKQEVTKAQAAQQNATRRF